MTNLIQRAVKGIYNQTRITKLSCQLHSKDSKEKPRQRLLSFVLSRYVTLVKSYEKTFPTAAKLYKTFSAGIREFKYDAVLLFKVYKKISIDGIYSLSRRELEIYHEMPKNMIKVAPIILIGTTLPFGAAIFALGCMFPKKTLSYHFWSETQRNEFALYDHKNKLQYFKPILSCMQTRLKLIKCPTLQDQIGHVLEGLKNGTNPSIGDILNCKQLFQESPYSIRSLGSSHTSLLLRLYNLRRGWRRKMRLEQLGTLVQAMDLAVAREGGVEKLSQSELMWASFFRGLNPVNMERDDVIAWLNNWLLISREIDESSYSLLLHCPVLLAYNEPTNVELLKS